MPRLLSLISALAAMILVAAPFPASAQTTKRLTFLHINDVYEIWPQRSLGGLANLATLLKKERARAPNAVFTLGGDLISPSLLSSLTRGRHMIRFMNRLRLDAAVLGNHEFDFGLKALLARVKESKFVWLGANVTRRNGKRLPGVRGTWQIDMNGIKVGVVGLVTPQSAVYIKGNVPVKFGDVIAAARDAVAKLRKDGAQVIVALTHLDMREDVELARKVPDIHLILGGHDHNPINTVAGRTLIVKAGSDAAWLAVVDLTVTLRKGKRPTVVPSWRMVAVHRVKPDPEILNLSQSYEDRLKERLGRRIARLRGGMSSESTFVRSRETRIGNLFADAVRASVNADIAFLNGGGIRGNRRYTNGQWLTARDILTELPFNNNVVVLAMPGAVLKLALEYGLSGVNTGRFPQVSGLKIFYETVRPKGRQIVAIEVGGKPLDPGKTYRVATVDFLAEGGDGYAMFKNLPRLVTAQNGPRITQVVVDYLRKRRQVRPDLDGRIIAK